MTPEIHRQSELYFCRKLMEVLPGRKFVPFHGGDATNDAFDIEPPFGVVAVTEAEKTYATEGTWVIGGTAQWVTHITETTAPEHSVQFREMYVALASLSPEVVDAAFSFSGIDVDTTSVSEDDKSRARAGIVHFQAGVSG